MKRKGEKRTKKREREKEGRKIKEGKNKGKKDMKLER